MAVVRAPSSSCRGETPSTSATCNWPTPPTHATAVRGLLAERLRGRGVETLGLTVTTGDPAGEAFVDGAELDLVALDAADGRRIGIAWLCHEELAAFLYDVEVDEAERGKEYGRALMDAAAEHARDLGMEVLGLNVFGHNHIAHALYDALGYDVVDRSCDLALSPRGAVGSRSAPTG